MNRRGQATLIALAGVGLLLALFQCWYISLPQEEAALFDVCRFSRHLDCFESLGKHGADLATWGGLPVIPALFSIFLFQFALAAFAGFARPGAREAWLTISKLISFPATGLAVYVLLSDYVVARATSASAVLIAFDSLAINVFTVWQGVQKTRLREGIAWVLLLGAGAAACGAFLSGAGTARREYESVLRERESAPPSVRWPSFAIQVPRRDSAALGNRSAPAEVLLFVDPSQEASQTVLRDALSLQPAFGDGVLIYLYAPGEQGERLLLAQQAGRLEAYLRDGATPPGDPKTIRALLERQEEARKQLGIETFPTVVWKGGRKSGRFDLRSILESAR